MEEAIQITKLYFNLFLGFLNQTNDTEQSYRLAKDAFSCIMSNACPNNEKKDSLSIFWDKGFE